MIGQRGLPATFGGVEHAVEELGARLAQRGHEVVVYCRPGYSDTAYEFYHGMRIQYLPTLNSKHLEAFLHSGLSTAHAVTRRFDIIHYHAIGPGLWTPLARVSSRASVVQTIHGLDDRRAKWGGGAQRVLRLAAWVSGHVPDATIVVSSDLVEHYRAKWNRAVYHITNGVDPPAPVCGSDEIERQWQLTRFRYLLFVGRIIPEKAVDRLVRAFRRIPGDWRLVIAGGSSHTDEYVRSVEALAAQDNRVILAGYVYGQALAELYAYAAAFVLPSDLEGLPLALLEAASHGTPVVASDIPPHVEILQQEGPGRRLFRAGSDESLVAALNRSLEAGGDERRGAEQMRTEVLRRYQWDDVTDATLALYEQLRRQARGQRGQ